MNALIKKGIKTIENDGILVFFTRLRKFSIVKLKRLVAKRNIENEAKWQSLKGKYKGKRIFIVGNGPSLNKTPLYLLKDEYTMCFNRFNLMLERLSWNPSFYAVTDDLVIRDMHTEINEQILPIVKGAFFPDIHPSNVEFTKYIKNRSNVYWLVTDKPEFRADLPNCGINITVVNAGMQIAAFLGFSEIYLLGVDVTFGEQKVKKLNSRNWEADEHDPNHFDPRYFEKGRKYHNPTVDSMVEKFKEGKVFFDKLGVKVYNAGVGGKLEVYPRVEFSSLFNLSEDTIHNCLTDVDFLNKRNYDFNTLQLKAIRIDNEKDAVEAIHVVSLEDAIPLISKLINEYLPIGPYNNDYYFVRRN